MVIKFLVEFWLLFWVCDVIGMWDLLLGVDGNFLYVLRNILVVDFFIKMFLMMVEDVWFFIVFLIVINLNYCFRLSKLFLDMFEIKVVENVICKYL